ncbi:MAG: hypothetical protein Q7P63_03835 [Verrucomicrobiota bacterium JB022]|nr:hypothetical protein [Verrucomicrobiota bacterium JB022]
MKTLCALSTLFLALAAPSLQAQLLLKELPTSEAQASPEWHFYKVWGEHVWIGSAPWIYTSSLGWIYNTGGQDTPHNGTTAPTYWSYISTEGVWVNHSLASGVWEYTDAFGSYQWVKHEWLKLALAREAVPVAELPAWVASDDHVLVWVEDATPTRIETQPYTMVEGEVTPLDATMGSVQFVVPLVPAGTDPSQATNYRIITHFVDRAGMPDSLLLNHHVTLNTAYSRFGADHSYRFIDGVDSCFGLLDGYVLHDSESGAYMIEDVGVSCPGEGGGSGFPPGVR